MTGEQEAGPAGARQIRTRRLAADEGGLAEAVAILARGGLVAFPTESVYGLGADATSDEAVARIFAAKGRPRFNPLISHLPTATAARACGLFDANARRLAEAFWPGPITLVVPAGPDCPISELARAGLPSVALRVPSHPVARDLLRRFGRPVAAPSANRSGRVSPTAADHVAAELDGRIDALIAGDASEVGVESTVVACLGTPTLLRPGGIARSTIEAVLGRPLAAPGGSEEAPASPGMLASHYAPRSALRLDAAERAPEEAGLDFGGRFAKGSGGPPVLDLSPRGDLVEAASHLFAYLRRLDGTASRIAVAPVPDHDLGEAINDRLRRAAAPRDESNESRSIPER